MVNIEYKSDDNNDNTRILYYDSLFINYKHYIKIELYKINNYIQ